MTRGIHLPLPLSPASATPAPAATPINPAAAPIAEAEGALPDDTKMEFFNFC
jgi:hypothetical protein